MSKSKVIKHNNAPQLLRYSGMAGIYRHKDNGRLYRIYEHQPRATRVLGYIYSCKDLLTGESRELDSQKGQWSLSRFQLTPYIR